MARRHRCRGGATIIAANDNASGEETSQKVVILDRQRSRRSTIRFEDLTEEQWSQLVTSLTAR